jgi:molybdate transport system ATP-binding protein
MIDISIHKKLQSNSGSMNLDVNFNISNGELLTLYGKSGAGKTTILKIIAGLLKPDKGSIVVNGKIWFDKKKRIDLRTQKRNLGFVFQDYSLFPNMSVKENLTFALTKGQDKKIVSDLMEIVDLGDLQSRSPNTLSGGQKQRVALARTLVQRPEILLLDEPLSALDDEMRIRLQQYILKVHNEFKLTTILISHDVSEIIKMSGYLMELDHGKIVSKGTPKDMFMHSEMKDGFVLSGEIISVEIVDSEAKVTVLIGRDLICVPLDLDKASELKLGEKIIISSERFDPVIKKIK